MQATEIKQYLEPTSIIDSNSGEIRSLAWQIAPSDTPDRERAVRLYLWVRDEVIYDPYSPFYKPEHYRASEVIKRKRGFCVPKASALCALYRASGIPARLGFADVKNHLASRRIVEWLGTDLFVYHGYVELFMNGRWIKVSPAFDKNLCARFGVPPLDFDGIHDAMLQAYAPPVDDETPDQEKLAGGKERRFMEYVRYHGTRKDVPIDEILEAWKAAYGTERVESWIRELEQSSHSTGDI